MSSRHSMYCPQCRTQVPDDSAFCHECGAAVVQTVRPEPPEPAAGGERQFRLHPAMAGAVAVVGGLVVLLLFLVGPLRGDGGLGDGSDEDQVRALVRRSVSLRNDRDLRGLYEIESPRYRKNCSFDSFGGMQGILSYLEGEWDITVGDISVSVEGDTAWASYEVYYDGRGARETQKFVKENGRWYPAYTDIAGTVLCF